MSARLIQEVDEFFGSDKPKDLKQDVFKALKYRWGFLDRSIHKLKDSSSVYKDVTIEELLSAEVSIIERLGWRVNLTDATKRKWLRL